MREHLYRGKRVDTKEFVYGSLVVRNHEVVIIEQYEEQPGVFKEAEYEVISETIGQFTGKLDRNDKQIFEGDVNQDKGVCVWNTDDASFCWDYKVIGLEPMDSEQDWCKVTGNIHDHETA